jgi:hypothetical protein
MYHSCAIIGSNKNSTTTLTHRLTKRHGVAEGNVEVQISYTSHARKRMLERGITEEEVEYCLSHYDIMSSPANGNPIYRATLPNGKKIKVVVKAKTSNPLVIITTA